MLDARRAESCGLGSGRSLRLRSAFARRPVMCKSFVVSVARIRSSARGSRHVTWNRRSHADAREFHPAAPGAELLRADICDLVGRPPRDRRPERHSRHQAGIRKTLILMHMGLTASTPILQPLITGAPLMTIGLVLTVAPWIIVAAAALVAQRRSRRDSDGTRREPPIAVTFAR